MGYGCKWRNEKMTENLKELKDWLLGHFDKIYGKLTDLKDEQTLMNGALRRVESDVSVLKGDVAELKTGLSRVESKLDAHCKQPTPAHV